MNVEEVGRAVLLLLGVGGAVAAAAWTAGLVLHGLGRPTGWTWRIATLGFGWTLGVGAAGWLWVVGLTGIGAAGIVDLGVAWAGVTLPLAVVLLVDATGRHRAAGLLLVAGALAWLGVWAAASDRTGGSGSPPGATAWVPAGIGAGLLALGIVQARRRDARIAGRSDARAGSPGSRRAGTLRIALAASARYGIIGPGAVIGLASFTATGWSPVATLPAQLVVGVIGALLGSELEVRWVPPRARQASEAAAALGRQALARVRSRTAMPVFRSERAVRAWLGATPETDASRWPRVEMLIAVREWDEAGAELGRMPDATTEERFRRALLADELRWRRGGDSDIAGVSALAAAVGPPGDPDRSFADGEVAVKTAGVRLAALDPDWLEPLAAYRPALGAAADGLHAQRYRRSTQAFALAAVGAELAAWLLLPR